MGLDQHIYITEASIDKINIVGVFGSNDAHQIAQWRNHHWLHEWVTNLWESRTQNYGGLLNAEYVELTASDLDNLELAIFERVISSLDDPFYRSDMEFVVTARQAIFDHKNVYYWAWW